MPRNSTTATTAPPAPSPSAPVAAAPQSSQPKGNLGGGFVDGYKPLSGDIPTDNGPDFFSSLIGSTGRGWSKDELTPSSNTPEPKAEVKTEAPKEPAPLRKEEPEAKAKQEAAPDPNDDETEDIDSDIDPDIFEAVLEKELGKSGKEEEVEEKAEEEKPEDKKADKPQGNPSEGVAAVWAGIVGRQIPLGAPLTNLPAFSPSKEAIENAEAGDLSTFVDEINKDRALLAAWAVDNAWHANAARVHASQAATMVTANAFDRFLDKNPQYRGKDFEEAIFRAVDHITTSNPSLSLPEALEKAKPLLDAAADKTRRLGSKKPNKTPAVVDQTGSSKGAGFKGSATRPRQAQQDKPAPQKADFNYIEDPYKFLMG